MCATGAPCHSIALRRSSVCPGHKKRRACKLTHMLRHLLYEKNIGQRTAKCVICGPTKIWSIGKNRLGKNRWGCPTPNKRKHPRILPYRRHKGAFCEWCKFIPRVAYQLDVDHIDGNHKNNQPSNLQTLCANCHRLKTYAQRKRAGSVS